MRQTYMDHHLIFLSSFCTSVCILSEEMKRKHTIITAIMKCLECSCGYGYLWVSMVRTRDIFKLPNNGLTDGLTEPILDDLFFSLFPIFSNHCPWHENLKQMRILTLQNMEFNASYIGSILISSNLFRISFPSFL